MLKNEQDKLNSVCNEIAQTLIEKKFVDKNDLLRLKRNVCKINHASKIPSNSSILSLLPVGKRAALRKSLMIKPVRTASGISVIAVMAEPHPCPEQAKCVYCPGGPDNDSPKSYTGQEPAALRGVQNQYNSYRIVKARLKQLQTTGHRIDKSEFIIMGGTFLNFPLDYQENFVKGCFDALNKKVSKSLSESHRIAETALRRNVGLTFETRADLCGVNEVNLMLKYGATRVEIGVQTLNEEVYRIVQRGHTLEDVISAFKIARNSGLKIVAHMMPGLPSSDPKLDLESFHKLFEDPDFKPDMLKIYPTLVVRSSKLYQWWMNREYEPYDLDTTVKLLVDVKKFVPKWIRIMRIQRDIPARLIEAGVKKSNLRELVKLELKKQGYLCNCIRCREIGLKFNRKKGSGVDSIVMKKESYFAGKGDETFLSFEDNNDDSLIGYLRLRYSGEFYGRKELDNSNCCLVRELHILGPVVPIGLKDELSWQHKGLGKSLMKEAERISREDYDSKKIAVMSAVGTRMYYQKLGYHKEGPYMVKNI